MVYFSAYTSPLGDMTIASDGIALIGLWFDGQKYHGNSLFKEMTVKDDLPVFAKTKKWLDRYFAGERPAISELPLSPQGSEFRLIVWDLLCKIPYGKTVTYGEIAKTAAMNMNKKRMSSQAVGGAVGHNPVSIIIPCHRVVGSDGNLAGYAGGIDRKIKLLQLEGIDVSLFKSP
jgi:methylated-DNA-[protein]-cysteine S-methyltransferase